MYFAEVRALTRVYFVRHAQSDTSVHDEALRGLTEKGMRDRALVTAFLAGREISAVFSSPCRRAVDTVADFAERYGFTVRTVEDFRERESGGWTEDFAAFTKRQWADFGFKLAGGESLAETQARNISALDRLLEEYAGKNVAVGSHGTALCTVINYFDSSFGGGDFARIAGIMPWIAEFDFDEEKNCVCIKEHDILSKREETK